LTAIRGSAVEACHHDQMSKALHEWFAARIPPEWPAQGVEVVADQDEIMVIIDLVEEDHEDSDPKEGRLGGSSPVESIGEAGDRSGRGPAEAGSGAASRSSWGSGRLGGGDAASTDLTGIRLFREATRDERMELAAAAKQVFGQKVSWGARLGDTVVVFTTVSVPVMTRLRLTERRVLDTLIDAGVARSRSEALSWCVRLVGENESEWISELRRAFEAVEAARAGGPRSRSRSRSAGGTGQKRC
jgi:hypothetical protein